MSDLYNDLFNNVDVGSDKDSVLSALSLMSSVNVTEDMLRKYNALKFICALVARLSFIASVWLTVFIPKYWYAMVAFLFIMAIFSNIHDPKVLEKHK